MKLADAIMANREQARPARRGLLLVVLISILALTIVGPLMTVSGVALLGDGSPVRQTIFFAIFAAAIVGVRPIEAPARLLVVPVGLIVALAWCWLSVDWALDSTISVRRLILTTIIIWSIFMAVRQIGYEQTVLLIRIALVAGLAANWIAVLGWPDFGIHQADEAYDKALVGEWRGIMVHKNFAGAICALTVLTFWFDARRIPRALRVIVLLAAVAFLIKTGSRTSVSVCVAGLVVGSLYANYRARYRFAVLGGACLLALVGAIYLNIVNDLLMRNLSDPNAFTGRTLIWSALLDYSSTHRLGTGYGSFWNIGPASPIFRYATGWVTTISAGHNGFIDLLVTIGLPGLLIVIVGAIAWPLARLFASPAASGARGALIFAIMLFCVVHNTTETSLFDRDAAPQVFLMIAIALLWAISAPLSYQRLNLRGGAEITPRPSLR